MPYLNSQRSRREGSSVQCCCSASRPPRGCCLALGAVGEVVTKVRRASVDAAAAVPALEVGVRRASVYAAAAVPALEVGGQWRFKAAARTATLSVQQCAWEACSICE